MPSPSVALLRTQSDDRLVALAADGHERAFAAIVERYRRPLLRHCRRYLPEARAEDALQQALVAAWTALRRGDDVQALRPWLYRIVHNTALNALRAAGYDYEELREILLPSDPRGGPAELAEHRAVVQRTLAGLAALPERQRAALLQIAVEGRSQDEVAEDLGLSEGAVRQLVHRARTTLRAAATAVMPLPLAAWLAQAGAERGDLAARLGELVAGAGAGATVAKAGAVAVLAGGAVGGPAVVEQLDDGKRPARAAAVADRGGAADPASRPTAPPAPATATPEATGTPAPRPAADGGGGDGSRTERARADVRRRAPGARRPATRRGERAGERARLPGARGGQGRGDDDEHDDAPRPDRDDDAPASDHDDDDRGAGSGGERDRARGGDQDDEPDDDARSGSSGSSGSDAREDDEDAPDAVASPAPSASPDDGDDHEGPDDESGG